jgi:phosphopantothenoylcysteine decarboxylase
MTSNTATIRVPHRIVLAVTGGIAAYKAADIISSLVKLNHVVNVIMTEAAKKFITPLTLAVLSKNPVLDDASEWLPDSRIRHIELAKWTNLFVVVPATANTIQKMATGVADNLVSSTYLALPMGRTVDPVKVFVCPAMNTQMWLSPVTQANVMALRTKPRHYVLDPEEGLLACGDYGAGKLPSVENIVKGIEELCLT